MVITMAKSYDLKPAPLNDEKAYAAGGASVVNRRQFLRYGFNATTETHESSNSFPAEGAARRFPSRPFLHTSLLNPCYLDNLDENLDTLLLIEKATPFGHDEKIGLALGFADDGVGEELDFLEATVDLVLSPEVDQLG